MVEIYTKTGIYLDLDPDTEFEISIESPLFRDDAVPVPFSTGITFLPTETNRQVFGYPKMMMLEPAVKSLEASIIVNGVPLFSGTLIYDGTDEDECLNYTFAGRDLNDAWSLKLYELTGFVSPGSEGYTLESWREAYLADLIPGIHPPVVMNAELTSESVFEAAPEGSRPSTYCNKNRKYRNLPALGQFAQGTSIAPAFELRTLLGRVVSYTTEGSISRLLSNTVLFGTYDPGTGLTEEYPAATLPDVAVVDFVRAVCSLICAAVYQDGSQYKIIAFRDLLADSTPTLYWDDKISDIYTSSCEEGEGYELKYDNDSGQDSSGDSISVPSLALVLGQAEREMYNTVYHSVLEDNYSCSRKVSTIVGATGHGSSGVTYGPVGQGQEVLIDRLNPAVSTISGPSSGEIHTKSIGFRLAPAAPMSISVDYDNASAQDGYISRMVPIISFPAAGGDRSAEMYIAVYGKGQACDKGVVFAEKDAIGSVDAVIADSLSTDKLFRFYHQGYAEWLAAGRQVISADLNLSLPDLVSFRLWHKVNIKGRRFVVRKLTVRLLASSNHFDTSAEFVSI